MKYFNNITSFAELKKQYRTLAIQNHPDKGGDTKTMQEINAEYDKLFPIWKTASKSTTNETAQSTRNEFYTQNGWKGENYNINLTTKDIAKLIREYIKIQYSNYKFSIQVDYNSINIALMEAPKNVFIDGNLSSYENDHLYIQVNHYYIENNNKLTEECKQILIDIVTLVQSYNYDDSDSMIDYFNTNFYIHLAVGKWDKPFSVVERKEKVRKSKAIKVTE